MLFSLSFGLADAFFFANCLRFLCTGEYAHSRLRRRSSIHMVTRSKGTKYDFIGTRTQLFTVCMCVYEVHVITLENEYGFLDAFYSSAEKKGRKRNERKGTERNGKESRGMQRKEKKMSLLPHVEPEMDIKIYI